MITQDEAESLHELTAMVREVVKVDDFAPEEVTGKPKPKTRRKAPARAGRHQRRPKVRALREQAPSQPDLTRTADVSDVTVYVVDGARTPFIKAQGKPGPFTPVDLAVQAGRPLLLRQPFSPTRIRRRHLGLRQCPRRRGQSRPRGGALRLGCGPEVPGWTVQRNCASGMQSIDVGYRYIADGGADLMCWPAAPRRSVMRRLMFSEQATAWFGGLFGARSSVAKLKQIARFKPKYLTPSIALLSGLTDPVVKLNMGQTPEVLAHRFGVTREAADQPMRSTATTVSPRRTKEGHLEEMHPMIGDDGKVYDFDDGVRPNNSTQDLGKAQTGL